MHYVKSGYVIQLIAFGWDKACIRSSPDPPSLAEVGLACETRYEARRRDAPDASDRLTSCSVEGRGSRSLRSAK